MNLKNNAEYLKEIHYRMFEEQTKAHFIWRKYEIIHDFENKKQESHQLVRETEVGTYANAFNFM